MPKFNIGDTVRATNKDEWTFGLVGKVVADPEGFAGSEFLAVEFDKKEAAGRGWDISDGNQNNRWYSEIRYLKAVKSDELTIGTPNLANDLRLGKQCRKILAHLERFGEVTNNAAFITYHVSRLSDVIMKLRRAGYNIETQMKKDGVGGQYAKYLFVR